MTNSPTSLKSVNIRKNLLDKRPSPAFSGTPESIIKQAILNQAKQSSEEVKEEALEEEQDTPNHYASKNRRRGQDNPRQRRGEGVSFEKKDSLMD